MAGLHRDNGTVLGNSKQPPGKHRYGIIYFPLGDRNRDRQVYGVSYLEERDSLDKYSKVTTR